MNRGETGFTTVELMITVIVLAVVMALAAPSFREVIEANRIRTEVSKITTAVNGARSEAVKRNAMVAICAPDDPNNPSDCSGNMEDGYWIVVDGDRDTTIDPSDPNTIIRVFASPPEGYTLADPSGNKAIASVVYTPDGATSGARSVVVCPPDGDIEKSSRVVVSTVGTPRIKYGKVVNTDACP